MHPSVTDALNGNIFVFHHPNDAHTDMRRHLRFWRWIFACAAAAPIAFVVLFTLYGWANGFAVGSGLMHLFEGYEVVDFNPDVPDVDWHRVSWLGDIEHRELTESSGLAASNVTDDVLWSMNDSGDGANIFALSTSGSHLGTWTVDLPDPFDWEAMDSFVLDGVPYLLIADVGDNLRWRPELTVVVVREPNVAEGEGLLPVEWSVRYSYPDGYRDCEAVAVDPDRREVLLLSKRRFPSELFRIPLQAEDAVVASKLAELTHLPRPTQQDIDEDPNGGEYRHMPSGMDLAGERLLITTYKHAFIYQRSAPDEMPLRVPLPSLGQREAIAFARGRDDVAYITKERSKGVGIADVFMIELPASAQTPPAVSSVEQ
jgi:hypothetical protein